MFNFPDLFKKKYSKEEIAKLLNTSPNLLKEFESFYQNISEEERRQDDNFFALNSRDFRNTINPEQEDYIVDDALIDRIVNELLIQPNKLLEDESMNLVTKEELNNIPLEHRPQLTGTMYKKDIKNDSYSALISMYMQWKKTGNPYCYHSFRQGLDVLDLDPITYNIIDQNPNSMGYWFPALKQAVENQDFFKVPETKIIKVPLPILQLTRLDYFSLNQATFDIVNKWCYKAFELDENKTYFIKTGTYSSKFDFRNAKVTSPQEVREIGQYLLFIHHQALCMAHYDLSGRKQPVIYGVSTTVEWVVREYIEDIENNPCIYHGMPLHTEYRLFVDFDKQKVLGNVMYWDADAMKRRFSEMEDSDKADMKHDYIIYTMHENKLIDRFNQNKDKVTKYMENMLPYFNLRGQWSVDVMQNGEDFWIIDMALADESALKEKVKGIEKANVNWLPDFSK